VKWNEAWDRARPMLDGVVRGRAPASEPGVELGYLDWGGDGDLVVIHHATGFCAATYALIAIGLRDRFRVVGFDARGHGDSTSVDATKDSDAYLWTRLAADYAAALTHLIGTTGRDRIRLAIGHSLGGILTLATSAERPGLIEEALLLDPVVLPPRSARTQRPERAFHLPDMARRRRSEFSSREEAYDHFAGRSLFREFPPESLALYVAEGLTETSSGRVRLKCHPEVEAAVFQNGPSMDIFALAPEIATRTRILHAARGNFPLAGFEALAERMPHASLESCDVGHLFAMEQPEFVLDRIEL
jgi:pimeloyl-ACP methyl ester carboxylesterase